MEGTLEIPLEIFNFLSKLENERNKILELKLKQLNIIDGNLSILVKPCYKSLFGNYCLLSQEYWLNNKDNCQYLFNCETYSKKRAIGFTFYDKHN